MPALNEHVASTASDAAMIRRRAGTRLRPRELQISLGVAHAERLVTPNAPLRDDVQHQTDDHQSKVLAVLGAGGSGSFLRRRRARGLFGGYEVVFVYGASKKQGRCYVYRYPRRNASLVTLLLVRIRNSRL